MPRFPVIPQRTSAPAAFSNAPRAQAAHFGAGVGRHLADLGAGAAELGQVVEQRQVRQAEGQLSHFDRELARRRLESDAQAPPGETGESRIERHGALFDDSAAAVLKHYEGQALHGRLSEDIAARRETMMQRLLKRAAEQRLQTSLRDTRELVERWSGRIAQNPSVFTEALQELLGGEAEGEPGLLEGLGLRPEALAAWRDYSLKQLLEARLSSDPAGLLAELESERWKEILPEGRRRSLQEDARDVQQRQASTAAIELGHQRAGQAQKLSADIEAGRAGHSEIRRAEDAGTVSAPQAEALRREVERAEAVRQTEQVATDELALTLSSGVGFDVANPQNRRVADAFYEQTYSPALRASAPEEVLDQVVSMVAKTGYLPPRLARDTNGLLLGGDEAGQVRGAELYGRLRGVAPELVEEAIDLEARAWGGVLKRWLEMGLEPESALPRANEEFPRHKDVPLFDDEETAVLQRDLRSLFYGDHNDHRVGPVLDRLERNFLDDLARGLTARQGRIRARRDIGRVMRKVSLFKAALDTHPDAIAQRGGEQNSLLRNVNARALPGPIPLPIPPDQANDQLAAAAVLELERGLRDWARRKTEEDFKDHLENMAILAGLFPSLTASLFGYSMLSLGDGRNLLGKILREDDRTHIRTLVIDHPEHGVMTVRQRRDITTGRYDGLDVTFWDREARDYVTEDLPSSRFFVRVDDGSDVDSPLEEPASSDAIAPDAVLTPGDQQRVVPSDEQRPILQPGPPAEPIPVDPLPPSEAGTGLELLPNHTGGNQADLGPRTDRVPGFPAQEQEPLILVNPDLSDDPRFPSVLFAVNAAKDRFAAHIGRKLKEAFKDIEAQTEIRVSQKQFRLLKKELQKKAFWERLSKDEIADLRDEYEKSYSEIILAWQHKTEQKWPTYKREVEENGKMVMRRFRYQVHHIIPLKVGGSPTAWWNVHPARFPDQHQGGLHRSDGPLNELTK